MRIARWGSIGVVLALAAAVPAIASTPDCARPEGGWPVRIERAVPVLNRFGERIAVDVHRPVAPEGCRFPVVLESSAYRDWTAPEEVDAAAGEDERRAWWVRQGYVFTFADVPGTGTSDGAWCMFCEHEQLSGVDMVEAMGAAPWSTGKVGLIGGSYPAINAMLIAQHRPKHLAAVIAAAFASDLYDDFIFPGGMPRGEDWLAIVGVFTYIDALSGKQDMDFSAIQREHPTDDDWFQERKLRPEDVRVPVYVLGGWNDIFDRSVWETFDQLGSKVKILRQGPITHVPFFPQDNTWPASCTNHEADFCGVALFDRFLKGERSAAYDALASNPVKLYVEPHGDTSDAPYLELTTKPATTPWTMRLGPDGATATVLSDPTSGSTGGRWFARGSVPGSQPPFDYLLGVDGPADQRVEEMKTLSIASDPLAEDVTIIGGGTLSLLVRADADDADIAVRIVDEWPVGAAGHPEGFAYRVNGGWLRASHRAGNREPDLQPLEPGAWTRIDVPLWPIGYRFAAGHRIRIDIAGADVPRFTPPASPVQLTIDLGASAVTLPHLAR